MLEVHRKTEGRPHRRQEHEVTALLADGIEGAEIIAEIGELGCIRGREVGRVERYRVGITGSATQPIKDAHLLFLRNCTIEIRHHAGHPLSHAVREIQEVIQGPVQVVGQKSDLLPEAIGSDRCYSPSAPPPTSTMTSWLQCGHVTSATVVPSVLMRR